MYKLSLILKYIDTICGRPTGNKPCFLNCHPLFVPFSYRFKNCNIQCKLSSFVCVNSLIHYLYKIFQVGISVRKLHRTTQRPHIQPLLPEITF